MKWDFFSVLCIFQCRINLFYGFYRSHFNEHTFRGDVCVKASILHCCISETHTKCVSIKILNFQNIRCNFLKTLTFSLKIGYCDIITFISCSDLLNRHQFKIKNTDLIENVGIPLTEKYSKLGYMRIYGVWCWWVIVNENIYANIAEHFFN